MRETRKRRNDAHLLAALCKRCAFRKWCVPTLGTMCVIPREPQAQERCWEEQRRDIAIVGSVDPRQLPPVHRQPQLPRITHVHVNQGPQPRASWSQPLGVYAKDAFSHTPEGCQLSAQYLNSRGLRNCPKTVVITGRDRFLARVCANARGPFLDSLSRPDVTSIMCPTLSAYDYAEPRVWIMNRAIVQNFMQALLERGLPGVLHTYLQDTEPDQRWLIEYLQLNPTQHFLATSFDRGMANSASKTRLALKLLREVQDAVGRPLHIVLGVLMTRVHAIKEACKLFPSRVHIIGQTVFMNSVKGSLLLHTQAGRLKWQPRAMAFPRGKVLFARNAALLAQVMRERVPGFFGAA